MSVGDTPWDAETYDVTALMRQGSFEFRGSRNDLGGHERALIFTLA